MNRSAIAALLVATMSAGCYHVTVQGNAPPNGQQFHRTAHMFVLGLIGAEVDAPCTPSSVETKQGVFDWILSGISLGLYTPYSVTISCSDAKQAAAPMAPASDGEATVATAAPASAP